MGALRFSIANLLAAVALFGIGLAALNSPSSGTAALLMLTTVVVILLAILGTAYRTGDARAFWLGVALFGGTYFAIAFTPACPPAADMFSSTLRRVRATFWTVRIPAGDQRSTDRMDTAYEQATATTLAWPSWHHGFGQTIHCLANLFFALAGGIAARWFYATRPKTTKATE